MIEKLHKRLSKSWIWSYFRLLYKNFFIKSHLKSQNFEDISKKIPGSDVNGKKILIPLIETSHYQYYQVLAIAKALELRGAKIKILLCGSFLPGCEIKSAKTRKFDPCLNCRVNSKNIVPIYNFETTNISDHISSDDWDKISNQINKIENKNKNEYLYNGIEVLGIVRDSVTRYYYGAVPEEKNNQKLNKVFRDHLATFMIGLHTAESIFNEWNPDIIFGNMNVYSSWAPYFLLAEKYDLQTSLVSISPYNYNSIVIDQMDLFSSNKRYKSYINARKNKKLNDTEKLELNDFISNRFSGKAQTFRDLGSFDSDENLISELNIDKSKKNIFLFSNIYWDIGMSESGTIFSGVIEWIIKSIESVIDQDNTHLYIKPHPAEVYDSASSLKGVKDFIEEKFPILPTNVTIIFPEMKIKTYDLFPYIDLGIIYNGTLGLEMMLKDIPVVVAGKAPYSDLKSVNSPTTRDKYDNYLKGDIKALEPDSEEILLFCYFYFIKSLLPFNLTETTYSDNFETYSFENSRDLLPGKDYYLDHLCDCILHKDSKVIEDW